MQLNSYNQYDGSGFNLKIGKLPTKLLATLRIAFAKPEEMKLLSSGQITPGM